MLTQAQDTYLVGLDYDRLERVYNRVYARMTEGYGYQPYGFDWPTMRMCHPHSCLVLKRILELTRDKRAID